MAISAAVVLYAICWFMVLFVVLPLRLTTQEEDGEIVPGTPSSAPINPNLKRKAWIVTLVALVVWAIACAIIITGIIPVEMFGFYIGISPNWGG